MKVFTAIWKDHHTDVTAHVFSDREQAIGWARQEAMGSAREEHDYKEEEIDGWEFYARYSDEGDCIYVVETELDKELAG